MSDPHHPDHIDHIDHELAALLAGECDRETTLVASAHLHACSECTEELISVAVATGALRFADRAQRAADSPITSSGHAEPGLNIDRYTAAPDDASRQVTAILQRSDRGRQWPRTAIAAAAAVILVAGGTLIGTQLHRITKRPAASVAVQAPLRPVQAPSDVSGRIQVTATGDTRDLNVHTSGLPAAPANHYYEVWVFNPSSLKMLPMGILGPSGQGQYQIAAPIMSGYSAVDISLQTDNGNPVHSDTSVLRAYL
jgi:Anti-sigma-K factor rskA